MDRIPLNRVAEMKERLADAYVKTGEYGGAIEIFEQLAENGKPQFHIMNNLAILYQNNGDAGNAAVILDKMADLFPNDYRVPMRRAFLEAEIQSKVNNEDRDYALTKYFYDSAADMYNENIKPGESDPEMLRLNDLIEQLKTNKWFE
jgi:serine/threonine-protein kinase